MLSVEAFACDAAQPQDQMGSEPARKEVPCAFWVVAGREAITAAAEVHMNRLQQGWLAAASALFLANALATPAAVARTGAAEQAAAGAGSPEETRGATDRTEVDHLMQQVLDHRSAAWRRLGDFVLRETVTLEIEGSTGIPFSGLRREYEWHVHDGVSVRSPVRFDGVDIDERRRRDYERGWLRDERRRLLDAEYSEPRLLADFHYFSEFTLEPGSFYLVGRETLAGREVLRIEYYPTEEVGEERGKRIVQGINKISLFTFWVDPEALQIVKYTFDNPGLDFLPLRWLVRVDGFMATMEMAPVGELWMPARMTLEGQVASARRDLRVTVEHRFFDYREADTGARLMDPGNSQ